MKKNIPDSVVLPGHEDYSLLKTISDEIVSRAGGMSELTDSFPVLMRECIDDVIQTARTGRRSYDELEKTEKTYIGTRVEIMLRSFLRLPRGKLDAVVGGHDVDFKNTMGNNWMIPTEALGHVCILVAADEDRGVCYLGLIKAELEYLTKSTNRDAKRSVSADGFKNILWMLKDHPYPKNFWADIPSSVVEAIYAETSGNRRMVTFFRSVQDRPIPRQVVEEVARQEDFMRRIRSDDGHGTRDLLLTEDILLLSGTFKSNLIKALDLPKCARSEFISHKISSEKERDLARAAGLNV